ncbi:MAG: hypothetical protein WBA17_02980 [Saprospiraceae bacterium]
MNYRSLFVFSAFALLLSLGLTSCGQVNAAISPTPTTASIVQQAGEEKAMTLQMIEAAGTTHFDAKSGVVISPENIRGLDGFKARLCLWLAGWELNMNTSSLQKAVPTTQDWDKLGAN